MMSGGIVRGRDDFSSNLSTGLKGKNCFVEGSNSRSFSPLDSEALHELSLLRIVASVLSIDPFLGILIMG